MSVIIRRLGAIALLIWLSACSGQKPPLADSSGTEPTADKGMSGIITNAHAAHGCPWLIDRGAGQDPRYLIPIGMDEAYLKDNTKLRFTYRLSRASSGACTMGTPAVIENITLN